MINSLYNRRRQVQNNFLFVEVSRICSNVETFKKISFAVMNEIHIFELTGYYSITTALFFPNTMYS